MFEPNLYTILQQDGTYGIHRFKDGEIFLVKQHQCGDWQTIRKASATEQAYMKKYGSKVALPSKP